MMSSIRWSAKAEPRWGVATVVRDATLNDFGLSFEIKYRQSSPPCKLRWRGPVVSNAVTGAEAGGKGETHHTVTDQIDRPSRKSLLDVAHQDCCALLDRAGGRHAGNEDLGIVAFEDFFDTSPVRDLEGWEGSGTEMVEAEELRSQRGRCVSEGPLKRNLRRADELRGRRRPGSLGIRLQGSTQARKIESVESL